jgi:biopolymer transport protein ExbD
MRFVQEEAEEAKFQMAPMIDMVFLLLIFFMCASSISQNRTMKMEMPVASKGVVPKERPDRWTVNILADGSIFSGDKASTIDELKAEVTERLKSEPKTKVYVRADANAKHKEVKKILNAMASIGVDDFIFGVYTPTESEAAAP